MTKIIPIKGDIVTNNYSDFYDWFGLEYSAPKQIQDALVEASGEDVEVQINSNGGIVDAGSEIYTALKAYTGHVTASIVGAAYSAASLISMAADTVQMSPPSMMMIHNVSSGACGDYHDMENAATMLKQSNEACANAYQLKTGLAHEKILELMDSTYWIAPKEAIELGFADKMMFEEEASSEPIVATFGNIPTKEKLEAFQQKKQAQAQLELELLTLGGIPL